MEKAIEEAIEPKDLESRRMKRQKVLKDPRLGVVYPNFLQETDGEEGGQPSAPKTKSRASKPAWGVKVEDSIMGNTKLAKDWSKHSTPS